MKNKFSAEWKKSSQGRKQRKYALNAPLHIRQQLMHAHLSKELIKKFGRRSIQLRTNDKVKVMRGSFKGKSAKVERIDLKRSKVFLTDVDAIKKDGSKAKVGLNPSNLLVTEINMDDKKRGLSLKRGEARTKEKAKRNSK